MYRFIIFSLMVMFGFYTIFVDADMIQEMLSNLLFCGAAFLFLIGVLKMFKEAFTGNGKSH